MPSFKSTTSRIAFLHIVAIALTAIFMPLVLFWLLIEETNALHQRAMIDQATTISRFISPEADGSWSYTPPPILKAKFSKEYGRYWFDVVDRSGRVLVSSADDQMPLFPVSNGKSNAAYRETSRGDRVIAGVSVEQTIGNQAVIIQVAEDLSHRDVLIDDIVANFFRRVGWITLPILLLLLAADIVIFRRAVRPLLDASRAARNIGPTRIDIRIPSANIPNEIRPLVDAVNQAFDRLERGYRVQREFTADAAHELRTPLAILRARLDQLEDSEVSRSLKADIGDMGRIVSQLLDAAEIDTTSIGPDERADLSAVGSEVVEMLAPLALESKRSIELAGAEHEVWVRGNAEMLRGAVRNLVENAINHTPPHSSVEVRVTPEGSISVIDRGRGVIPAERALIFQRFWRRDRGRPGSAGLGLSIVQRIVEAHAGTIDVTDNPGGGAVFTIRLPLSNEASQGEALAS
jgi:signal transduction histidine kinase